MTCLLHASDRWVAWSKPAGIPVFPPHADPRGDCLFHRAGLSPEGWPDGFEGGIAHRLDTPTTGLVLAGQTPADLLWLRQQFQERRLHKHYLLVTRKTVPWTTHLVDTAIAHDRRKKAKMVVKRGKDTPRRGAWLEAQTRFRLLAQNQGLSVWQATMQSGVMHQIRLHAASVGLALAGDRLYGGGPPVDGLDRFLLHHVTLRGPGLVPPVCPLPEDWPRVASVSDMVLE